MSGSMTQRHNHDFHGQCKINEKKGNRKDKTEKHRSKWKKVTFQP